jgi:diphosphomevalonate decarboxylase
MVNRPPLVYWNPATLRCMQAVKALRDTGLPVFFTIDAGPQLKAICEPSARPTVVGALRELPGVEDVIVSGLGSGVEIL